MRISADFKIIPNAYTGAAAPEDKVDGVPVVSFPFYIDSVGEQSHWLHWQLTDPDSIPVCGFEWIHWCVANMPVEALMFDFNDSHALAIPPDFSRQLPSMIPEALQGRTSAASKYVGSTDPSVTMRYNGPTPPDKPHGYELSVWATASPLPGLAQGFWLNDLRHAIVNYGESEGSVLESAGITLMAEPAR
ncbi:YbhB/YbcL family Raf kinase inhibitor-like protein [Bifidobacterium bombi]|uniref:Phospholipid-binding protein n=2 Tax=Bifidobacterium bombi TaxID=471511 RepID=A0A080N3A1_9BIFI|nr:YbhB/YbcL family Raf kinase inhibitor-like protein [Bifidobacterium bombi]KFF31613.1 phospholipid-binding protein [Bifidobacterium bombi DSM 19703]